MRFSDLLSRADDATLQTLLGTPVLRLLRLLDAGMVAPARLRALLTELRGEAGLLADAQSRALLIDLLRPGEAENIARALNLSPNGDVYAALRMLQMRRGSEREQTLFNMFALVPPTLEAQTGPPAQRDAAAGLPLFAHQRNAARKVKAALAQEPRRVLLHMPTGAGKTRTAMHIIADHLRANEPALVIWLAYSEELCEQAASEFEQSWQQLGDRAVTVQRFWGGHELDLTQARDGIIVAGLAKMYRAAMDDLGLISRLAGYCSLVVIDEAHQAIAETYQLVLNTLVTLGRTAALLGLTATPGRTWNDVDADAALAAFFGERKVVLEIDGYANPVDFLIADGYLAQTTFRPLLHTSGIELSPTDLRRLTHDLDIPAGILKRLAEDEQRNLLILLEVERLALRHRRLLVFAASVEHAELLAAVLRARGIYAAAISGTTPATERTRRIADYKAPGDEPRVLCNYGVLTTGFDAPQTSAAIIARPTKSLVLYSQMVGRAMRGPRVGGNASAEIVTVVDVNLPGFSTVADAFTNWEDVWRNL
jgi:superfamily II DNA or RNA helicase